MEKIVSWLDKTLNVAAFDDVSNNGLQIEREEGRAVTRSVDAIVPIASQLRGPSMSGAFETNASTGGVRSAITPSTSSVDFTVAFAVDASVRAVEAAARAGAQLLVVHHGISWGGGVKRLTGGVYNVVRAAMGANLAIYASHLPLDAHPTLGNNAQLAKLLGLKKTRPAFCYHGSVIGLVGRLENLKALEVLVPPAQFKQSNNQTIKQSNLLLGLCSGGAGEFAEEAKRLGCDLYLTGEASWGDVIAAENCGMPMICAGHYETEVLGVRAVAKTMKRALKVKTIDLTEELK